MILTKLAMTAVSGAVLFAGFGGFGLRDFDVRPVGENCWVARDLTAQALERIRPASPASQVDDANQLLQTAIGMCNEYGDAWYYRSLAETRLGRAPKARFAREQATEFHSTAMTEGINPFVLATPSPDKAVPPPPLHKKWALIVGIGSFRDPKVPPLPFSGSDAQEFYNVLVQPTVGGFEKQNVHLLSDGNATLTRIRAEINWLARNAAADDMVVVYIATHGSSRRQDTRDANYILANDTVLTVNVKDAPYERPEDALYATALPMVDLSTAIATRLKSRRVAIFLDTCYSGGAMGSGQRMIVPGISGGSVSGDTLSHVIEGSGRIIFAASKQDEQSWESPKLKHGYFTYYLVQALRAHPDLPLTKLFSEVQASVSASVDTDHQHLDRQTPVMSRSEDHLDFALGVSPAQVPAVAAVRPPERVTSRMR